MNICYYVVRGRVKPKTDKNKYLLFLL